MGPCWAIFSQFFAFFPHFWVALTHVGLFDQFFDFGSIFERFGEGFGELFKGLEVSRFLVALWGFALPSSVFCGFLAVLAAF